MSVEFDIRGIHHLSGLLERLPQGVQARGVAQRLGAFTTSAHDGAVARMRPFPANFSALSDDSLSNEYAFWNSELMRITEVAGLLDGQRKLLELNAKKARARARSAIRRRFEEGQKEIEPGGKVTKPTAGEINDSAEESDIVMEADTALVMLDVVLSSVHAYREGCITATTSLSREYSLRQAQFTARVRA